MPFQRIFQQDNVPKHTSKLVNEWFWANGFKVVMWPAPSFELNPIEHLMEYVNKCVAEK